MMKHVPNQTIDYVELQRISIRIEELDSDLGANIATVQENSVRLTKVETALEGELHTLLNLSIIVDDGNTNSSVGFVTSQAFTTDISNIMTSIKKEREINEEHDTAILQLESD